MSPRFFNRRIESSTRGVALRCWYVRLMWPTSLILLLVFSLPRVTTLAGVVYLVVIDVTGIIAGLQGVSWSQRTGTSACRESEQRDRDGRPEFAAREPAA